jgi:hypothetical protein
VDSLVQLDLTLHSGPPNAPKTASVRDTVPLALQRHFNFSLELRGATSDEACRIVCRRCGKRKLQRGTDIVDYDSPTDLVEIVDGRARICFRLKCYAHHNRPVDDGYVYAAK